MKSMHKKTKLLLATTSILTSSIATATVELPFKSYVGADAQIRHMNFEKGYGQNLFKHDITQGNVFFGVSLTENFRVEAGYEANPGKTRTSYIGIGDVSAGVPVTQIANEEMSTTRINGPHISLAAVFPLKTIPELKLFGSIGVAHLKMNLVRNTSFFIEDDGTRYASSLFPQYGSPVRTFLQTKNILKLNLGFEYDLSKDWGVRALAGWENTKKFNIPSLETGTDDSRIKPKNSMLYSLGVFLKL